MKNELPKVYSNPIDKEIKNNKEYYYSREQSRDYKSPKEINKMINQIFASKDFVYKKKIRITTFDNQLEVNLVGRTNNNLLTLDNQKIALNEIINIEEIV